MIKVMTVIKCDICGVIVPAQVAGSWRNEDVYGMPPGWKESTATTGVHICPNCGARMEKEDGADD